MYVVGGTPMIRGAERSNPVSRPTGFTGTPLVPTVFTGTLLVPTVQQHHPAAGPATSGGFKQMQHEGLFDMQSIFGLIVYDRAIRLNEFFAYFEPRVDGHVVHNKRTTVP